MRGWGAGSFVAGQVAGGIGLPGKETALFGRMLFWVFVKMRGLCSCHRCQSGGVVFVCPLLRMLENRDGMSSPPARKGCDFLVRCSL